MKKVLVIVLLATGALTTAFSQETSKNNYTGNWEDNPSWVTAPGPTGTVGAAQLDLTINGFITRNGGIAVSANTFPENFVINDTLVIRGNFTFGINGANLVIGPDGVLIIIGDFTVANNHVTTNNGIFVVTGDLNFPTNDSEIYSGVGEVFAEDGVVGNTTASGANNWGQLDDLYPVIYNFVMCEQSGGGSCVLPVKLSYFLADLKNEVVELKWATIMEENFQKFVIQRSSSGTIFEDIGELPGKGFNIYDIETQYEFVDEMPLLGLNYYRLKAVDLDDSYEYFQVRMVLVEGVKTLAAYPNPSSGESISFNFNFDPQENDRIVLIDQMGSEVFSASATSTHNEIVFDSRLRPGIYMLRYVSAEFEQTSRIVVRN